jgi:[citrate (pro-3S)-lyase] ligase
MGGGGGILKLRDYSSKYVNIMNGHRITLNQPQPTDKTIYMFGGCIFFGAGCPDNGTCSTYLQSLIVKNGRNDFCVENYGAFVSSREKYIFETIMQIPFKKGDILFLALANMDMPNGVTHLPEGCFNINIKNVLERPHKWGDNVYFDQNHPNQNGQQAIAQVIFDFLCEHDFLDGYAKSKINSSEKNNFNNYFSSEEQSQFENYLKTIKLLKQKIGSIVMNCNPFTLGHRYLIEYAASQVEHLYIFVVEEDKSFFPFTDRFELVKKGTANLPNVTVLPSGKFIISSLTFTDYFGKSEMQDRTIDPSMDVEIFAREIAPAMGINIRFAGEEPLDNITLQYNNAMKRILPLHGIDFEVIPRKEFDGKVISASRVRELLKDKKFDEIAEIVPESTLNYLKEKFK